MDKELALRTFGYLIGQYKTHNETTINKQEIEAIEFILKDNEFLEQQCKKQKEVIDNINQYIKDNSYKIEWGDELQDNESLNINDDLTDEEFIMGLLDILNEVSE